MVSKGDLPGYRVPAVRRCRCNAFNFLIRIDTGEHICGSRKRGVPARARHKKI